MPAARDDEAMAGSEVTPARREPPAVEFVEITKRYPHVTAADRVTLAVGRGEVLCLLGENGAGKSTLMGVLSGLVHPDSGEVRLEGRRVEIDSPRDAIGLGIGMVHQHSSLVPQLTVLENLLLGEAGFRLDEAAGRARLDTLGGDVGFDADPGTLVGALALGQQQQLEVVRALWRGSRVLVLDEPTSMLTPQGVAELGRTVGRLAGQGLAVVFITHKLHEALSVGDRLAVLSRGRLVGEIGREELRSLSGEEIEERIVSLMFGARREHTPGVAELASAVVTRRPGRTFAPEPALELRGVTVEPDTGEVGLRDVSLTVRKGEILGVAGVDGNGQRELAETLAGQRSPDRGDVLLFGTPTAGFSVARLESLGLRYVTDDRLHEGTVPSLSVAMNVVLKEIGRPPYWRRGRMRYPAVLTRARELIGRFGIQAPSPETPVAALSGGNVQKVVLARELSSEPKLVVYSKPTSGLDVRATVDVRETIRHQAAQGVSAIVISTDLEELLELCDRIAVLSYGALADPVDNGPDALRRVGELMVAGERP